MTDPIPYADIDAEIRPLVSLLNSMPGIHTTDSCAGHGDNEEAYVAFVADSQEDLARVLGAIPIWGMRAEWIANRPSWKAISVDVTLREDGHPWYGLRVYGFPQWAQRRAIAELEAALRAQQDARRPCSTCASGHRQRTAPGCSRTGLIELKPGSPGHDV